MNKKELAILPELPIVINEYNNVFDINYRQKISEELMPEFNNFIEEKIVIICDKKMCGIYVRDILDSYLEYVNFNNIKKRKGNVKLRKKWILNYFLRSGHNIYELKNNKYMIKGLDFKRPYPF